MTEPTTAIVSSQSAFPGRATWRTVVQNVISVILTAGVVLPLAVAIAGEELSDVLPANWLAWAVGASASVAAIAAALTRIMAIPAVDAALRRFGLSSTPKTVAPVTAEGVHVITTVDAPNLTAADVHRAIDEFRGGDGRA